MRQDFDLCVIGSGSGLAVMPPQVTKYWRTALVDAGIGPLDSFGGTCLNAGCIPTKMFSIPAAHAVAGRQASRMNLQSSIQTVDFEGLQGRIFARTDKISQDGLAWQLSRENVKVFRGIGKFVDEHSLLVGDDLIHAKRFVLAAGSRPRSINKPGFDEGFLSAFVHNSDSIMRIEEVPRRLVIVGGGIEAVEFAHIFSALGSRVTLLNRSDRLLRHEDSDIAQLVFDELGQRISLRINQDVSDLDAATDGGVVVTATDKDGIEYSYNADIVLETIGRIPNSDLLDVDKAGIAIDPGTRRVQVDELGRTNVPHIWALGDICNTDMLKHLANVQSRTIREAFLAEIEGREYGLAQRPGPKNLSVVPRAIFTVPEVAAIGLTQQAAQESGEPFVVFKQKYGDTAWGWALNDESHFVKLIGSLDGQIIGAHVVGPQASTLIQPIVTAMTFGISARQAADRQFWAHPAPPEVIENALIGLANAVDAA